MGDVLCPVLVGRDAELSALTAALAATLAGTGQLIFVTGEPGIGKSRLARELASRASSQGAVVITGRAVPSGASTPFRPLTEALLQALRDRQLPADALPGAWLAPLGTIVPVTDGTDGTGRAMAPAAAPGEASAAILGEAVLRLLRWLAGPGGLMLVLEDLHWADPDTLGVLEYLGDNLAAQPVLCVATCRDEPASSALELARRLRARRTAQHLALSRLAAAQVAVMVRACLPDAGADLVSRVQHTADGVPFLVEEVLAAPGVPASFRDGRRWRPGWSRRGGWRWLPRRWPRSRRRIPACPGRAATPPPTWRCRQATPRGRAGCWLNPARRH